MIEYKEIEVDAAELLDPSRLLVDDAEYDRASTLLVNLKSQRMIKIGILGTHGAGKTTLALGLAAAYKRAQPGQCVEMVSEVARTCPLPISRDTTPDSQRWMFCQQMTKEIEASARADILICDRTVLDNLAYARWAGFFGRHDVASQFRAAGIEWMDTYDRLYYVRPTNPPDPDGVRLDDYASQEKVDLIIWNWLNVYEIPYIETSAVLWTIAWYEKEIG